MKRIVRIVVFALVVTVLVSSPYSETSKASGSPRGYLTTPSELREVARKASQGKEPYASSVRAVMSWANRPWGYQPGAVPQCPNSDSPAWLDNSGGAAILYGKALAYHLTGDPKYANQVKNILQRIMTNVKGISLGVQRCRLTFAWGTPELVAAADLIEDFWDGMTCTGPLSTVNGQNQIGSGPCKELFQNWLVKNPYYVISYAAEESQSNWGAAATNALAYIADYLWDRPEVRLIHRMPPELGGGTLSLSPSQAYARANKLALDRMNGYRVDYHSSQACDFLAGVQQSPRFTPVKSQITDQGIIPEDARRQQRCNINTYNGTYQNYPQIHLGNLIQQCELMLRRGSSACYDNVDRKDIPDYSFIASDGKTKTTHLYPGRGSIERAINAIIIDSRTEWRHDGALIVAYRYYSTHGKLGGTAAWYKQINQGTRCDQDICFGRLTHGLAPGELPRSSMVELAFDTTEATFTGLESEPVVELGVEPTLEAELDPTAELTGEPSDEAESTPEGTETDPPTVVPTDEPTAEPPGEAGGPLVGIESDDVRVQPTGSWTAHETALASGGRYVYSSGSSEDSLSLTFSGTRLDVVYVKHPALGVFVVEIDGSAVQAVDSVAADSVFGARVSFSLAAGDHTLRIYPLSGTIAIDAFGVPAGQEPVEPPVDVTGEPTAEPVTPLPTEHISEPTSEPTSEPVTPVPTEPISDPTAVPATPEPTMEPPGSDSGLPVFVLPLVDSADSAANWQALGAWRLGPDAGSEGSGWTANAAHQQSSELTGLFLVELTSAQQPVLRFWQRVNLAAADQTLVELSLDGGQTWQLLDQQAGQVADWSERVLDLSAYQGQRLRLRFRLEASGLPADLNGEPGWHLDTITISELAS